MPQSSSFHMHSPRSRVAERFLAHAELWRRMASQGWNEKTAQMLELLTEERVRAARNADGSAPNHEGAQKRAAAVRPKAWIRS